MKNFVWISCLWFFVGCAYPGKQGYKYVEKKTLTGQEWTPLINKDEQIFRARISFKERSFSGLMAVKKTVMGHRFAFLTEVGMTMFDIEVGQDTSQLHYCFEPLNRKALLKLLENDFRRLALEMNDRRGRVYKNKEKSTLYKSRPNGDKLFFHTQDEKLVEMYHPSIFPDQVRITATYQGTDCTSLLIDHKKLGLLIELSPV